MWCVCSLLCPARPLIPTHATQPPSSASQPRRRRPKSLLNEDGVSTDEQLVGKLDHTLIATLQSSNCAAPIPKSQQQRKQQEAQISGSDVLWALQRASARNCRKKKIKQEELRRASSSVADPREEESSVDYTNVRPLRINPHWAAKLDELENRLRELSDTI